MLAVSLKIGNGVRLIKPAKQCICTKKHYKHDDRRMVPGLHSHDVIMLSHSGNIVTRTGLQHQQ